MKKRTIVVEDLRTINSSPDHAFRIVKLVNSTQYVVGNLMAKDDVEYLCRSDSWTVNIIKKK